MDLEDIKFHQCVKLNRFESDRTISFIPPDGEFDLMSYRLNTKVCAPAPDPSMGCAAVGTSRRRATPPPPPPSRPSCGRGACHDVRAPLHCPQRGMRTGSPLHLFPKQQRGQW